MQNGIVSLFICLILTGCTNSLGNAVNEEDGKKLKVAFYNAQNFFDTLDESNKDDAEYLPAASKQWNTSKYKDKLVKISKVIQELNTHVIGLGEVENTTVLKDLMTELGEDWKYVHYESKDTRGIDVALVYNSNQLKVITSTPHKVEVTGEPNYKTRDLLQVQAVARQDTVNFIVCHYHSRLTGIKESKHYRMAASNKVNAIVEKLPKSQLTLVIGDFNANPTDEPMIVLTDLNNPAKEINLSKQGSLPYNGEWQLYDQILYYNPGKYNYQAFNIFNPTWLTNQTGFYKDYPFRTYAGDEYLGGYSDHFPVYIEFNY